MLVPRHDILLGRAKSLLPSWVHTVVFCTPVVSCTFCFGEDNTLLLHAAHSVTSAGEFADRGPEHVYKLAGVAQPTGSDDTVGEVAGGAGSCLWMASTVSPPACAVCLLSCTNSPNMLHVLHTPGGKVAGGGCPADLMLIPVLSAAPSCRSVHGPFSASSRPLLRVARPALSCSSSRPHCCAELRGVHV